MRIFKRSRRAQNRAAQELRDATSLAAFSQMNSASQSVLAETLIEGIMAERELRKAS